MSRRFFTVIVAAVAMVAALLLPISSASAATYSSPCYGKAGWSTGADNSGTTLTSNRISGFAAGRQAQGCDRLVITLSGTRPVSFRSSYGTVYRDGSGLPMSVAGRYDFRLSVWAWPKSGYSMHDGRVLYPTSNPKGLRRVVQVKSAGYFEGITLYAIGLNAKKPFRVFTLTDRARGVTKVVVEFRH